MDLKLKSDQAVLYSSFTCETTVTKFQNRKGTAVRDTNSVSEGTDLNKVLFPLFWGVQEMKDRLESPTK